MKTWRIGFRAVLVAVCLMARVMADERAAIIETIAGTGQPNDGGDGGSALKTNVGDPFGVELGPDGALFITEVRNHRVRRLDLKSGALSTVAGNGTKGYSGDGGPATQARLNEPYEVRFDRDGHMFFVEMMNHIVRRMDSKTGVITTIAGTGEAGFGGDGGPATKAQFRQPHSIALDGRGGLFVADIGNHRIRRIDLKTGVVDSVAGNGEKTLPVDGQRAKDRPIHGPRALFVTGTTMWIALREGNSVWKMNLEQGTLHHVAGGGKTGFTGDGGPAKDAMFNGPKGIAIGPRGDIFVVDTENQAMRRIDAKTQIITTVAGGGPKEKGGAGDGGPATAAQLDRPHGICIGSDGSIYIGDTLNHRVRRVNLGAVEAAAKSLSAQIKEINPRVFSDEERKTAVQALADDQRRRFRDANERSTAEWRHLRTRGEWEAFRATKLAALKALLGEFPAPPKSVVSHVTGTLDGDGFVIEKLLFESRPGVWVSANLYRPARSDAPAGSQPGLIISHSHHTPKTNGELQDMGMTWARLGCVVLVPDHIGHGERRQHPFATDKDFEKPFRASRQDYYFRYDIGLQLDIVGQSLMGQMVWDLSRGVDVLLARPAVDAKQIILLGAVAGGGDPAAVAAALDERIAVAVPFNFGGPQPETRFPLPDDAEMSFNYAGSGGWESTRNLRGSAAGGFLPWVIVGGIVPRRLIYGHEFRWDREHDPVWRRLETIYGWYDAADRLAFTHGRGELKGQPPEASHCTHIGPLHRERIHAALHRWFDIPNGTTREFSQRRPADDLFCWTEAFLMRMYIRTDTLRRRRPGTTPENSPQYRLLREQLATDADERLAKLRKQLATLSFEERRQSLRDRWANVLGSIEPAAESKVISTRDETLAASPAGGTNVRISRVVLDVEPGITLPLLLLIPPRVEGKSAPVVVAVSQAGKAAFLNERADEIAELLASGIAVCLPDVRGTGESSAADGRDRTSGATAHSSSEQMLGGTLFGARLRDLRSVLSHLRSRDDVDARQFALWGDSFAPVNSPAIKLEVPHGIDNRPRECEPLGGLLALFTGLYERDAKAIYIHGGLASFRSIFDSPCVYIPHDAVIPGALVASDVSDIAATMAPRPLRLSGLVTAANQSLPSPAENNVFAATIAAYRSQSAEIKLQFGGEGVAAWLANSLPRE